MRIHLRVKRIYDEPSASDGCRILVDRLWPRGIKKSEAALDRWEKLLAPSNELRKWFHADSTRFDEFANRYRRELDERAEDISKLIASLTTDTLTLITSTRDPESAHVGVLRDYLLARFQQCDAGD